MNLCVMLSSTRLDWFTFLTPCNRPCWRWYLSQRFLRCSVANAMVCPPNWATIKTVGPVDKYWATFHLSTRGSSFFFKLANSLSIQSVFQCPRTFSSSTWRMKTSWRAIKTDYPLYCQVWSCLPQAKKPIWQDLVHWSFGNTVKVWCRSVQSDNPL